MISSLNDKFNQPIYDTGVKAARAMMPETRELPRTPFPAS
jgi:hypothetical protein